MNIPTYLPFTVVAGCIATIVALVIGVNRALSIADRIALFEGYRFGLAAVLAPIVHHICTTGRRKEARPRWEVETRLDGIVSLEHETPILLDG